jgi:hypothetical protein
MRPSSGNLKSPRAQIDSGSSGGELVVTDNFRGVVA